MCETPYGNHGIAKLHVKAGWNLLLGQVDLLSDYWSYQIRVIEADAVSLHAIPDLDCENVFSLAPAKQGAEVSSEMLSATADCCTVFDQWEQSSGSVELLTPARQVAWDRIDFSKAFEPRNYDGFCPKIVSKEATWCFEFEREFYGHPRLQVSAPAGSVLDVSYGDWNRKDGRVDLYGSNPLVDATDRFILKGGSQCIHVLNPRGGIFLQVTLRAPSGVDAEELSVYSLEILDRSIFPDVQGAFGCGNAVYDFAWNASVATFQASTDEAYSDCPWRERGSYIGDALVTQQLNARLSTDLSVARRTFNNFGRAALPGGQLPCCAPSWLRLPHEDFTYLWILSIRDHWALTGDVSFVHDNWAVIKGIWRSQWDTHSSGLWNANGRRLFIDWGCLKSEREGEANAVINILRIAALQATGELARISGFHETATHFEGEAGDVRTAVEQVLWDEEESRFLARLGEGKSIALHANILALRYKVGDPHLIFRYLEPHLRENLNRGLRMEKFSGYIELYYLYFLLPALAELGRCNLAEELIEQHYGYLATQECLTLSECFGSVRRSGSLCHVWSSAGALYLHENVLGVRQAVAGNPDKWILEPRVTERFSRVSGVLPHRLGDIKIQWERDVSGQIEIEYDAPVGVEIVDAVQSAVQ
ncbi:hypothetical protein [Pelagicoccus albus]|uniref:Alpha-L-rhamnosidase six-hairpin glycosidase domain-containing protein n=1 Tax=Pelagicoccus albus TaxID=415222 RepID=A0A7X1EAS0_9BACT|nr:hypothetical protein [Pelagicoccus albus]